MNFLPFVGCLLLCLLNLRAGEGAERSHDSMHGKQRSLTDTNKCAFATSCDSQAAMLSQVLGNYYSIGYVSLDLAAAQPPPEPASCGVRTAMMQNKMGNVVSASVSSVRSSVLIGPSKCPGFGLCADIIDTPASTGWPISFLSYLVLQANVTDSCSTSTSFSSSCTVCLAQKTAYDYAKWILTSESAASVLSSRSFASLPQYVVERIKSEIFPNIVCAGRDGNFTRAVDWPADTQAIKLVGGGSSVQREVQAALANAFNIETSVSIAFVGSGAGTQKLVDRAIHFEMRDQPFDPAAVSSAGALRMVPIMAAAVVPMYNMERDVPVVLSRAAIAGIFLASVVAWSDSAVATLNKNIDLAPQTPIRIVHSENSSSAGVHAAFVAAIRSFANLSSGAGQGSSSPLRWPVLSTSLPQGVVCSAKPCKQLICNPGSFYDASLNDCSLCLPGTFSVGAGSHSCTPCPPSSYSSTSGAKACSRCSDTSYQSAAGSTACLSCPSNTRRYGELPRGSQAMVSTNGTAVQHYTYGMALEECLCLAGFWLAGSVNDSALGGLACEPCPDGAACGGFTGGVQTAPTTKVNFWGDPLHPDAFFECEVGHCLENYQCASGRTGRLCRYPLPGFFLVVGQVYECTAGIELVLYLATAAEILFWVVLVNFACCQYHSLGLDMVMLQTSGYIAKLQLRWHPRLRVIGLVASFFNFELENIGLHCAHADTWTEVSLFYWQLAFPFVGVLLCAVWWMLRAVISYLLANRWLMARLEAQSQQNKTVRVIKNKATLSSVFHTPENFVDYIWIKFLMFLVSTFPVLVYSVFSIFSCQTDARGVEFLVRMPSVECWGSDHWAMIFVDCVYIPVVLIGGPVVLARRLHWGLQSDLLHRCAFMECYGWIYARYKCEYAWWEIVVLVRRALIAACAAMSTIPLVSASAIVFILNVFLCAQLFFLPQVQRRIRLLEVGSIFCCMIQTVAGILISPSLDTSSECIGSSYLDSLGSMCDSNNAYKGGVTVIVLVIYSLNLFTSVALFLSQLRRNIISSTAIRAFHQEFDLPYDEYDIQLSNMTDGSCLAKMIANFREQRSEEVLNLFRDLNATLPRFVMFNHSKSGYFAQDEFARTLNKMLVGFPGLFDWIAQADRSVVSCLASFIADYAAYAREHHSVVFGEMILAEYRPSFLVWLTTCDALHREQLCELLLGMAMASGRNYYLRPGEIRDRLLEVIQKYIPDWQDNKGNRYSNLEGQVEETSSSSPTSTVSDAHGPDDMIDLEQSLQNELIGIYASESGPSPSYLPFENAKI